MPRAEEVKTYARKSSIAQRQNSVQAFNALFASNLCKRKLKCKNKSKKQKSVVVKQLPPVDEHHHLIAESFENGDPFEDTFDKVAKGVQNYFTRNRVQPFLSQDVQNYSTKNQVQPSLSQDVQNDSTKNQAQPSLSQDVQNDSTKNQAQPSLSQDVQNDSTKNQVQPSLSQDVQNDSTKNQVEPALSRPRDNIQKRTNSPYQNAKIERTLDKSVVDNFCIERVPFYEIKDKEFSYLSSLDDDSNLPKVDININNQSLGHLCTSLFSNNFREANKKIIIASTPTRSRSVIPQPLMYNELSPISTKPPSKPYKSLLEKSYDEIHTWNFSLPKEFKNLNTLHDSNIPKKHTQTPSCWHQTRVRKTLSIIKLKEMGMMTQENLVNDIKLQLEPRVILSTSIDILGISCSINLGRSVQNVIIKKRAARRVSFSVANSHQNKVACASLENLSCLFRTPIRYLNLRRRAIPIALPKLTILKNSNTVSIERLNDDKIDNIEKVCAIESETHPEVEADCSNKFLFSFEEESKSNKDKNDTLFSLPLDKKIHHTDNELKDDIVKYKHHCQYNSIKDFKDHLLCDNKHDISLPKSEITCNFEKLNSSKFSTDSNDLVNLEKVNKTEINNETKTNISKIVLVNEIQNGLNKIEAELETDKSKNDSYSFGKPLDCENDKNNTSKINDSSNYIYIIDDDEIIEISDLENSDTSHHQRSNVSKKNFGDIIEVLSSDEEENGNNSNILFVDTQDATDLNTSKTCFNYNLSKVKRAEMSTDMYESPEPSFVEEDKDPLELNLQPFVLKTGKLWRRSLLEIRRNSRACSTNDVSNGFLCSGAEHEKYRKEGLRDGILFKSVLSTIRQTINSTLLEVTVPTIDNAGSDNTKEIVYQERTVTESSFLEPASNNSIHEALPHERAKSIVLRKCKQEEPIPFQECYPYSTLLKCRKIGEGVYGEVFLYKNSEGNGTVIKIIPIEGSRLVNEEPQKKYSEILSEIIIAMELSNLRHGSENYTSGFSELKRVRLVQGKYPPRLIDLWDLYDEVNKSENESPEMFEEDQLYIILELANGGTDMESFLFKTADEAYSLFKQIACSLAVAEHALEFEHRDLHWGNVLICRTDQCKRLKYCLNGQELFIPSNGIEVSIIDFTLSRVKIDNAVIYNDISKDPDLFSAVGEYQFEIYKLMQQKNKNQWEHFEPYSNVLWMHYVVHKMITALRYTATSSRKHKTAIHKLLDLQTVILNYKSVDDLVNNEFIQ
ncbi:hypothetical protein FQA39_LY01643 [Lamprigera yunnana]|nr:hypothetical protein FQA39_LY01643 [Lamprigera yunnana]